MSYAYSVSVTQQDACSLCQSVVMRVAASRPEIVCQLCRQALRTERTALRLDVVLIRAAIRSQMRAEARAGRRAEVLARPRLCSGCGQEFVAIRPQQRFHSAACRASRLGGRPHNWPTDSPGNCVRYGREHRAERRRRAGQHRPSDPCARCGQELGPMGPHLHLDHDDTGDGYLGFAHRVCNQQAGARVGRTRSAGTNGEA